MSRLSIHYGRIRYVEPHPGQESLIPPPPEPLRDAVLAARSVERYGHEWVLANLEVDDAAGLIAGHLGYPGTDQVVREDLEEGNFVLRTYELPGAVSSRFVLNYRTGDVAFERGRIRPTGFINHFVALLRNSGTGKFVGELVRVARTYREFLEVVDKVKAVAFEVRPTNPRDRRIFRPLDEGMKAANADVERVYIENKDEGLVLQPPASRDEETPNPAVQGIEMVEEGYGSGYRIDAERDGQPLRFASKGGGLLRDVIDDAPEDETARLVLLREQLERRQGLLDAGAREPLVDGEDEEPDDQDEDDDDDFEVEVEDEDDLEDEGS